jgi:MFS family permease
MKLPPQGWHPWQNIATAPSISTPTYPKNLLKSRSFYGLWICYAIAALVGLSAIGISSPVGGEIIDINPTVAASSVSLFALFNGISRPLFGWLCDRLVQRDVRWQVGLPMLGVLISLPCAVAFLLWPAEGYWAWAGLKIPHAMAFSIAFGFFGSWWPSLSYSAISHMVRSSERGVAAALLNFFITLFGIGVGPLLTGVISDLLTPSLGAQALRWSLVAVMLLLIPTALLLGMSLKAYRQQWNLMNKEHK